MKNKLKKTTQHKKNHHFDSLFSRTVWSKFSERIPALAVGAMLLTVLGLNSSAIADVTAVPPVLGVAQLPLTVAVPAHPQVMLAVGNSESMDGNLSGALLTGSGSLTGSLTALNTSSSPVNYTVPSGFVPPVTAANGSNLAPYTATQSGNLVDNGASRLNVAKAGLQSILSTYLQTTDFGLMDYSTSSTKLYTTWVYYMSNSGGFTFTNSPGTANYVANPCYKYKNLSTSNSIYSNCSTMDGSSLYSSQDLNGGAYMLVQTTSDNPSISDVLYAGSSLNGVFVAYNGPSPASPFPPSFTLAQFNSGSVFLSYSNTTPNAGKFGTGPTNAGYVPFTKQVMYSERGFGFAASQSATTGSVLVPMTSAGQTPTAATQSTALAKFTSYLLPETNSASTAEIKASGGQSPIAGLLSGASNYFSSQNPASSNGCTALRYVVLLSDGLPTLDLKGSAWPPLGSAAAVGYGVTATFNADGSLNTTNDQALTDTISTLASLRASGIKTYIIGLGAGVDPAVNPLAASTLTSMAIAGGTNAYFAATSPVDLTNDLQIILSGIVGATQSTSSAAVNSTGLNTGSAVYQSQFNTSDQPYQDWTGNIFSFSINPSTGVVNTNPALANWKAQPYLDTVIPNNRVITTWSPSSSAGIPFRWTTTTPAPAASIGTGTILGTALTVSLTGTDPSGSNRLNYLRGDTSNEKRNGGTYRNRSHILGDIVDSAPLYVSKPLGQSVASSYFTFQQANINRQPVIYVGANDGMLHAFNATNGNEIFAHIPNGVFAKLPALTSPYYNQAHQFYVDGSPQASDVQFSDGSWHTVLASGENAGGSTIFAIDITDPTQFTNEASAAAKDLWEFSDINMGYSFSTPSFNNSAAGWAVFFGNGYNGTSSSAYFYAVNAQTGAQLAKINLCAAVANACSASLPNGLSGVQVVNSDGLISQPANVAYAGDLQGNLWRIDISNADPTKWVVSLLFQARDSSGNPQPITVTPETSLNPSYPYKKGNMVFFGTGELVGYSDISNTQVQTVYGIYDPGVGSTYTRSNLVQQTLAAGTVNTPNGVVNVRTVSGNAVNLNTKNGWYVDLGLQSGEREVTSPVLEAGGVLLLTTYTPTNNVCTAGGQAYLLALNFATGGALPQPELDVTGDGKLTNADQSNGKNPVGLSLGNVYAAQPSVVNANFGPAKAVKLITESNGQVQSVLDRGATRQRTAWWEVR